jgi:ATP-binding cassette subfamily F protein 3
LYAKSIDLFTGNYSAFEIRKAARLAEQEANYNKQQREIAHMQNFVRRFKAKATKAKQAQSRVKALERMEIIAQAHVDSPFSFSIKSNEKISNPLLVIEDASLGYESIILKNINFKLQPGDRFGLLGHNGAGKSTLIKSLMGELKLIEGEKKSGTHLKIGYFSQHQVDDLDINLSAFEHIKKLDISKSETEIRSFLGGFDFKNDKVEQSINIFSGGEKARLALAKIAYLKPNLLLLDEPTNHLDIDMRHALTIALQSFEGAILLISHDRHLLANSVDSFYLLHEGELNEFQGDLEDYRNQVLKIGNEKKSKKVAPKSGPEKEISKSLRLDLQQNEKRSKRLIKKLTETEELLNLPDAFNSQENDFHDLLRSQVELKAEIQKTEDEWLELTDKLEGS